ncbi:synaptotagmin-11 [Denticeps clupeoides]|uniref:C2 domain-containing protein n=1 Tax=Denticeps clupeoides TaxID=299321 RepID=A0AAY4B485_9TELE|nr:synaptotagmin-11-like [Denticeps clupeoides]
MEWEFGEHLQILLAVGLAVFCFCLVLGCILCWWRSKSGPPGDKEADLSVPSMPVDQVNITLKASPSVDALPIRQQYQELEGEVLEFPSSAGASTPSEDAAPGLPLQLRPRSSSDQKETPHSCFPLRGLSSPAAPASPHKPTAYGRTSLPSVPKLGLVSKTRKALGRRSTVTGDLLYTESSHLTGLPVARSLPTPSESPQTLYGSGLSSTSMSSKPPPLLHFTLLFSSPTATLTLTILGLYGASRRLGGAFARVSLPPVCPNPMQVSGRRRSLSPEFQSQSFLLPVGTAEALRSATLRLAVISRDFSGLREAPLGELELPCGEIDWEPDTTITCIRELNPAKRRLKKSMSSQDALSSRRISVGAPQALGQLFILLQYQTLAHRIKVMVRKAENLAKMTRMPGAPDHYVVINLRHGGKVVCTKETKGAAGHNAVWNAPFLFDLPLGDITQLPLVLEFIIMQGRLYTKSSLLGRVLIGYEGPESGQQHWKEMCSRGQVETARWHTIQPDSQTE